MDIRLRVILTIGFIFFGALFINLFHTQIIQHVKYLEEAKGQQIAKKEIAPDRGKIYTKEGSDLYPLATNLTLYSLSVVPNQVENKEKAAQEIAPIINQSQRDIFDKINNNKPYLPPLADGLDDTQAQKIKDLKLSGVYLQEEKARSYPERDAFAHILGFVNKEGEGQYGLEGYYDGELKGEKGVVFGEKDLKGRIIYFTNQQNSTAGTDLITTIDRTIQWKTYKTIKDAVEKFKAKSGSVIIIDPNTGAILAMVNYPSFDPNKFNEVKPEDYNIFQNSSISQLYEPGSVFKIITMSAGIDAGKITPDTTQIFDAFVKIGSWTIWNWDKKPHGKETMTQVLETSDNIGAVYVSEQLGKETFYNYLKKFGFGSVLGIDLANETAKPLKIWKQWKDVELATIAFGQGISVTPLEVISATAAIANGGKLYKPYLVGAVQNPDGKTEEAKPKEIAQVITPATATQVTQMMVSVVEKGHGKKAKVAGFKVAGKTGTAQVPKKDGQGYEENLSIGSFVGFAPAENPKFVMLVKLDEPQGVEWAESTAAPVFGELADWLLRSYWKVAPTD